MRDVYETALDYLRGTPVNDFDARIATTPGIGGNLAKMLRVLSGVLLPSPQGDNDFIKAYAQFHAATEAALPPVPLTDGYDDVRGSIRRKQEELQGLVQLQDAYIANLASPQPNRYLGNHGNTITQKTEQLKAIMASAGIEQYTPSAIERWLITSSAFVWEHNDLRKKAIRDRIRERLLKIVGREGLEDPINQTLMNTHIAQGIRAFNGMANAIGTSEFHALQYNPMDKAGTPIMASDLFKEAETRTRTFLENALLGVGGRIVT